MHTAMNKALNNSSSRNGRPGTVLLAVLIVIVVLSLAAYKYSELMSSELRATNNILKNAQVKAFAESGVHYTAAIMGTNDSISTNLGSNFYDNPAMFQDIVMQDTGSRQGLFSIVHPDYLGTDYSGDQAVGAASVPLVHGVVDEAGKINLNAVMLLDSSGTVLSTMLMQLPNMTQDIANSIVDWMDADETTRTGGAESDYYESLNPPYHSKNGPLDSLEELLLVKGVTPDLLFGNDYGKNGQIDPRSLDANSTGVDPGWINYLTIYSRECNFDSTGAPRLYLNGATLSDIYSSLQGLVGNPTAAYVIGYRLFDAYPAGTPAPAPTGGGGGGPGGTQVTVGTSAAMVAAVEKALASGGQPKRSIPSMYALIGSKISQDTITQTPGQGGRMQTSTVTTVYSFPLTDPGSLQTTLPIALDKTTLKSGSEIPARININTAPRQVLMALPGLTEANVDQIIQLRPAAGAAASADPVYSSPAWLATEMTLSPTVLQGLEKYVTTASQVYRFQAVGYFSQGAPLYRVEAVVDANNGSPRIVYYRDLTDLGLSLDPRQQQQQQP